MITTLEANGSGVCDKPGAGVGACLTLFSVPAKPRGYVLSPVLQKETREATLLGESHTARSLIPDSQPQTVSGLYCSTRAVSWFGVAFPVLKVSVVGLSDA